MERSRTVTEAKSVFLRKQIRLLSAILQPSSQWRETAPPVEEAAPSDKAVEEAMGKVNAKLKQHNRQVYSDEATRHVAEQIDILYWNAISSAASGSDPGMESALGVEKGADLTNEDTIRALPDALPDLSLSSEPNLPCTDEDVESYATLHAHLTALNTRRTMAQNRLAHLQALKKLLIPYQNPQVNIQPNLVTRNGELGKELDRMRMLLARVTSAIQQRNNSLGNGHGGMAPEDGQGLSGDTVTDIDSDRAGQNGRTEQGKLDQVLMDLT